MIPPTVLADRISTVDAAAILTYDAVRSVREHRIVGWLERVGCAVGSAELVKATVREERPDHSDRKSFWSEHTAVAAAASFPYGLAFGISVTVDVGSLRVVSRKHWAWDALAGAASGTACSRLDRRTP